MTRRIENGDVVRRTALETFAGTGAVPTDGTDSPAGRRPRDDPALIDVDVPTEYVWIEGGAGTIERVSLTVADIAFDADAGLRARGHLRAGGTGANDATWLCNRPFETLSLSLSLPESGPGDLAVSLAPVDIGDHGVVTLAGVPVPLIECGRASGRGAIPSLLRAIAGLSE